MITAFDLQIEDVFILSGGETVIVGPVDGGGTKITPVEVVIVVDDEVKGTIKLHGERMPGGLPSGHRAVFTNDSTLLTSEYVKTHRCRLTHLREVKN